MTNYRRYIGNDYSTHFTFSLLLQGFATRFILSYAIENGGRFEGEQIEQLKRLGGWAEKSQVVHLYIKRIVEEYSDTCGLLVPGRFKCLKTNRLTCVRTAGIEYK